MLEEKIKPVHPFPARMATSIAWEHLTSDKRMRILDPMVGSGTTLAVGRYLGHETYGVDSDPLASVIASCWCSNLSKEKVLKASSRVLAKASVTVKLLRSDTSYPVEADRATRKFIKFWFDLQNRKELTALSLHIRLIRDPGLKKVLLTGLSKMIITKSAGVSLAMDVSHSRPHKVYEKAPLTAFELFSKVIDSIVFKAPFAEPNLFNLPASSVVLGDSRNLTFPDCFFDAVITSPPYLNAIDYLRASKMSLVWMGFSVVDVQKIRSSNIGTERVTTKPEDPVLLTALTELGLCGNLPNRERGFTYRYIKDMYEVLKEVTRVLKPGGKAIFVVGNSTLKNVYLSNSNAIASLGRQLSLQVMSQKERVLPNNKRYMPIHSSAGVTKGITNRMRTEVVIEFAKPN